MLSGRRIPILVGLALTLFFLWLQFTSLPLARQAIQRLDYLAYDLRLKATLGTHAVDPRIVVVDIDEKSLKEEGHWPWPRDRIARLVNRLFAGGAKVVAFDMVFAEPERNSAQMVLAGLKRRGVQDDAVARLLAAHMGEFDNNAILARELGKHDVVLGFILHPRNEPPTGTLPRPLAFEEPQALVNTALPKAAGYTGNLDVLHASVPHGGFFSILPDSDGILRRSVMLQRYDGKVYPSLALEAMRLYLGAEMIRLRTAPMGDVNVVEVIEIGDHVIPTDQLARAMIPFRGEQGGFPYVSATDVLRERVEGKPFDGRIILIGTTAQGLFDLRATPVQGIFPGVEVHADLLAGMLDNNFPVEPTWAPGANFVLTLLLGVLLSLLLPRLSSAAMAFVSVGVVVVLVGCSVLLWVGGGLSLATTPPLLLVGAISSFNIAFGFWRESRDRRRLKNMFGQYVPKQLVEEMNRHPDRSYGFAGESRDMSVLFCDIRGFTSISERLTAGQLKQMLNRFFTPMTRVIFDHRGTIDKYVGDMIMAFWGAPVEDPDHAEHAVATAMDMLKEADRLSALFVAQGLPPIGVGIGVNSGVMNVGDMGSEYRRAYTVIGDVVNLASRLEGTTRFYGNGVVIGEGTWQQIKDKWLCRELDRVRVKGKSKAITVYAPLCRHDESTREQREELARHDGALAAFRSRQWEAADEAFAELEARHPQVHLYALYRERIAHLRADDPGEGWDGVYDRTTK
jgi:adenylate cyclase